jgi:phosphatidylglycerol---prolipoprotein diacylglyceryl transferase
MIPILFKIGPLTVYSYGLMMALGFIAADYVISLDLGRRGYNPDYASTLVVWAAVVGIAGSRLLDVFNNFSEYLAHPWTIIFSGSGFVWYGGLIGGLIAVSLVARYHGIPVLTMGDICGPALAIGQAIGRIGCQLAGDGDWGLPSKLPWAMTYPRAIVGWGPETVLKLDSHGNLVSGFYPGVRVHPAPIYETILYLGVFAILWSARKKVQVEGRIFYLYLILAGACRFLVEFVRINPRVLFGLSEAQLIAIGMIAVGIPAYFISGAREPAIGAQDAARARA